MLKTEQLTIERPAYKLKLSGYVIVSDRRGFDVDYNGIFSPYAREIQLIEEQGELKTRQGFFRCIIKALDFSLNSPGRSYNARGGWAHYEVYSSFHNPEDLTIYACKWQNYPQLEEVKKYW